MDTVEAVLHNLESSRIEALHDMFIKLKIESPSMTHGLIDLPKIIELPQKLMFQSSLSEDQMLS